MIFSSKNVFDGYNIINYAGRMTGGGVYLSSFGMGTYPAHFCADFQGEGYTINEPKEHGIWRGDVVEPDATTTTIFGTFFLSH